MVVYTPEEIADMLKINIQTVRRYLRTGKLRGAKFGKQWRISEKQLEEFFEEHCQNDKVQCG